MSAPQMTINVNSGETILQVFQYASQVLTTKAITGISNAAPVQVTAPAHGMVAGWPACVVSAVGMVEINSPHYPPHAGDWHAVTVVDPNNVQFNDVNSGSFSGWLSGGFLVYPTPMVLTGMTAAFTVFDNLAHTGTPLASLTGSPGIVLDNTAKTITVKLATTGLSWTVGYFELMVTDTSGNPKELVNGVINILP